MTRRTAERRLTLQGETGGAEPFNLQTDPPTLLSTLLEEQRQLTAVELFSRDHTPDGQPAQARRYSRLLPATPPGPGQQYAFDVDLDRCSGCKACVTACHSLNGLDDEETWRDVGLLVGGGAASPVMQHVTTACHHCLQPACLSACPVDAYEKDPLTGIVKHLDDQCFGCQYCTLACPYDVPKYHKKKGVVRKCDMCSSRLARHEPPACVQGCPHEAISIQIVEISQVLEDSETNHFLPAAPDPDSTLPATTYRSRRVFPRNMLPADYYSVSPQHPHWPLILMLVLTQLSVGAFITGCLLDLSMPSPLTAAFRPWLATHSLFFGFGALAASVFHLGRPQYAFRGIIGIRHSWLSREILAFGLFAGLAMPYAAGCWLASSPPEWSLLIVAGLPALGWGVCATGLAGVFCSAMLYAFTRKELWSLGRTLTRFLLTSALLGAATAWLSVMVYTRQEPDDQAAQQMTELFVPFAWTVLACSLLKLAFDSALLRHLFSQRNTPLKRSALLVTGVLSRVSASRLAAGVAGGIVLPLFLILSSRGERLPSTDGGTTVVVAAIWIGCLLGEFLERYLFFSAVVAPRMPGGIRP